MEFRFRNVNDAFRGLIEGIHTNRIPTVTEPSRVGEVMRIPEPVLVHYTHPRERVLLNVARDANPFFHLYEAIWMLAGRRDIAPLAYYSSNYATQVQDGDDPNANGAYGYRWRHAVAGRDPSTDDGRAEVDQLETVVAHLTSQPHSRRAVLGMWTVDDDLLQVGGIGRRIRCPNCHGTGGVRDDKDESVDCRRCARSGWVHEPASKDVCCNTHAYFDVGFGPCRVCDGSGWQEVSDLGRAVDGSFHSRTMQRLPCPACGGLPNDQPRSLNMTVCNRSNDLLWGLFGANYVHFTFLQEYLAARLGLDVGSYRHFSNNLHAYVNRWRPREWLAEPVPHYPDGGVPLAESPSVFAAEVDDFAAAFSGAEDPWRSVPSWRSPFLATVAAPLLSAFRLYKEARRTRSEPPWEDVHRWVGAVGSPDWEVAARTWLARRAHHAAR